MTIYCPRCGEPKRVWQMGRVVWPFNNAKEAAEAKATHFWCPKDKERDDAEQGKIDWESKRLEWAERAKDRTWSNLQLELEKYRKPPGGI